MALSWSSDLSVGVFIIDQQHKELFNKVNELLEAMGKQGSEDQIKRVVQFLENYTVEHFKAEESLMKEYRYPKEALHKTEHADFIKNFLSLKTDMLSQGLNATLTIRFQRQVCNWLVDHIAKSDKDLGVYIRGIAKAA